MIDIRKIQRFEATFEKVNTSSELAKFWNELEPSIIGTEKHISELEQTIQHFEYVDYKRQLFEVMRQQIENQLLIDEIERIINGS